jgi:hypothetical protein
MEWRVIEAKLFTERSVKTEWKELKELRKDLEKYTRTRYFGGLRSQVELRNMTHIRSTRSTGHGFPEYMNASLLLYEVTPMSTTIMLANRPQTIRERGGHSARPVLAPDDGLHVRAPQ